MEIISKISKGSKMDQIYISKNRTGLNIGSFVIIKPLEQEIRQKTTLEKPYFYNIKSIEPLKLQIIEEIIKIIDKKIENQNVIFTGSFLEQGFNFNDIDIIIVRDKQANPEHLTKEIEAQTKIKTHIILLDNKTLLNGLNKDPLYQMMLSKCITKKRIIFKTKQEIDYKLLDLHLLKSKLLVNNFDVLNGNEKYYLIRNIVTIFIYLKRERISSEVVDKEIKRIFNLKEIKEIKLNLLNKPDFLRKYKNLYEETSKSIFGGIKNGSK